MTGPAKEVMPAGTTAGTPQVLLAHHLKHLKLPTVLREYDKVARECARDGVDHPRYLLRLVELELIDRERRMVERRIRAARFPAVKSFDTFDFTAIPSLNKMLVLELARCGYILRRENIIALGNSGTGKTHVALALGLAACQKGFSVAFTTAASLVSQLLEARDEKRLLRLQRELQAVKLLIVDELGYVPLSPTGAELLFEVFSQRYERGSTIVTSNLPFEDWTSVLGSERLTGALLDRLTHHVSILAMNGDSYRLRQSAGRRRATAAAEQTRPPPTKPIPKPARSSPEQSRQRDMARAPIGALATSAAPQRQWPAFTPPRWPGIRPPLTTAPASTPGSTTIVTMLSALTWISTVMMSLAPRSPRMIHWRPKASPSSKMDHVEQFTDSCPGPGSGGNPWPPAIWTSGMV